MMNQWRRPQFFFCAWLAIIALATPSFAWNCASAAQAAPTCPLMVHHDAAETSDMDAMPCCAKTQTVVKCPNNCCNPLPQFPGSDHKGGTLEKTHASSATIAQHLAQAAQNIIVIPMLPPAPLVIEPPQSRAWPDDTSLLLTSQFAPAAQAGRAPPR